MLDWLARTTNTTARLLGLGSAEPHPADAAGAPAGSAPEFFATMFHDGPLPLLLTTEGSGRIVAVNAAAEAVAGRSAADLCRGTVFDLGGYRDQAERTSHIEAVDHGSGRAVREFRVRTPAGKDSPSARPHLPGAGRRPAPYAHRADQRQRDRAHGRTAALRPADGGHRTALGRRRPSVQQPADGDAGASRRARQRIADLDAGESPGGGAPAVGGRRVADHQRAADLRRPQPGAGDAGGRQRRTRRTGAGARARARRGHPHRVGPVATSRAGDARPRAARPAGRQSRAERPRRHARRRPAHVGDPAPRF